MSIPVVLITGALTGIGRAATFAFAQQGNRTPSRRNWSFGIAHLDMPLTPQKIWAAIQSAGAEQNRHPAKAGAQGRQCRSLLPLDSRFRGNDGRAEI